MELAVDGLAVVVEQLKGVRAVAVHVAVAVGKTAVAEQEGHLQGQETGNRKQETSASEKMTLMPR